MKRDGWIAAVIGAVLAFCVSFGGIGCLVTGMGIDGGGMLRLALCCAGAALLSAACFQMKWGGWLQLALTALGAFALLKSEAAAQDLAALVLRMTGLYDSAYGWGVIQLGDIGDGIAFWPLAAWGWVASVLVNFVVCREKNALIGVIPGLLPLFLSMVVMDTVPTVGYLYPLLLAVLLLLLTDHQRRTDARQANALTAMLALPTALALGMLFWTVPQESYVNNVREYQEQVAQWLEEIPSLFQASSGGNFDSDVSIQNQEVDLDTLGPLIQRTYPVMTVTGGRAGKIYLREQDYDLYDGTSWTATDSRWESFNAQGDFLEETTLSVTPNRVQDHYFVPYYPTAGITLIGGQAAYTENSQSYEFAVRMLPADWRQELETPEAEKLMIELTSGSMVATLNDYHYRSLPDDTRQWAESYLAGVLTGSEMTNTDKADAIAACIRASARYDTNTGKMPGNAGDFARWFLEDSETGYCVHFASAAVVLLRAAGIPARYVTGYAFTTDGEMAIVRAKQAHAWAEYYEPRLGMWIVLEATPADLNEAETESTVATETAPSETGEETFPDLPIPTQPEASEPTPTTPVGGAEMPQPTREIPGWLKALGQILLGTGSLVILLHFQRHLRLRLRHRKYRTGNANRQALARWRELEILYRCLGTPVPEELRTLAEKARFSQHRLTPAELQSLDQGIRIARGLCGEKPWYRRLVDRYFFAAY